MESFSVKYVADNKINRRNWQSDWLDKWVVFRNGHGWRENKKKKDSVKEARMLAKVNSPATLNVYTKDGNRSEQTRYD